MDRPNPQTSVPVQSSVCACLKTYVYNRTKRAVSKGNRGNVTMRESLCMRLHSRDKDLSEERKMSAAGLKKSELHPPTASRPSSRGLTQEELAGMRKWLKA